MKVQRKLFTFLLPVLLAGMLSSCVLPGLKDPESLDTLELPPVVQNKDDIMDNGPVKGGTLKLFTTQPDTLNPLLTRNVFVQDFLQLVFEGLVQLDHSNKPIPMLAERWEVSEDGLTWTFFIKDNIRWHDGPLMTAYDVEFTVKSLMSSGAASIYQKNVENISVCSALNSKTFKMVLKQPYSFTAELMTFPILPRHRYTASDLTNPAAQANWKPVGTGPFKFQNTDTRFIYLINNFSWSTGESVQGKEDKAAYLANIQIAIGQAPLTSFQTGETDCVWIDRDEVKKFNGRTNINMKRFSSKDYDFISMNTTKGLLKDKEIRQAVAYSINRAKLIDDVLPGEVTEADLPVLPDTWINDTSIKAYDYNPLKARQILEGAGWKLTNGVFVKKMNGVDTPLTLELLVNNDNDVRQRVAQELTDQLKTNGIQVEVKVVDWQKEMFRLVNGMKYDMAILGWRVTSIPDMTFAFSSAEIPSHTVTVPAGRNVSGYANPVVDQMLAQMLTEKDEMKKKAIFVNLKQVLMDDMPQIGLFFYNDAMIYQKKVRGLLTPTLHQKYSDIVQWYIPMSEG